MVNLKSKPLINHHKQGMRPALAVMEQLGFTSEDCLRNCGISVVEIENEDCKFGAEQEFQFYRNILQLSENPMIGLDLGRAFKAESYGLLGYAMISARSMAEVLCLASDFSVLTYSHFHIKSFNDGTYGGMRFELLHTIPADLLQIYSDRDLQAALEINTLASPQTLAIPRIAVMHDNPQLKEQYQTAWNCSDIAFGQDNNQVWFEAAQLDSPLPQADAMTSNFCREQCEKLLFRLSRQSTFVNQVRECLVCQPGNFRDLATVAKTLGLSARTLRRRLNDEGHSFQQLNNEIRLQLANDYLQAGIAIERVSELLGYSEPSNFSHAFKRWSGESPRDFIRNKTPVIQLN